MGLFARKCAWCGAKLANPSYVERMGRRFCSEDHAQKFLDQVRAGSQTEESHGCC